MAQTFSSRSNQGVNRMDDSAFVVRCKFSTVLVSSSGFAGWSTAKIQAAFAEAGIKFAPKRVIVEAVTPELAAAGAAARQIATEAPPGDDRG